MVSEDKLIKTGIKYSDNIFELIKQKVLRELGKSKDLEEFLARTEDFTLNNPLISTGYQSTMTNIILQSLNDTRFARASQRELVRTTVDNCCADLIRDVGEDIKNSVRDIVKKGYDDGLHSHEIGKNITKELDSINRKRARTIARTEVKRANTIANYIYNKERGATHFTVACRTDACPKCKEEYGKLKGDMVVGYNQFNINETDKLPPLHPNCRCGVRYQYSSPRAEELRKHIRVA